MEFDYTIGGVSSNSYASVEEAKDYFKYRLHSTLWLALSSAEIKIALMTATRVLDRYIEWQGIRMTREQALDWPASGVVDKDGYSVSNAIIPSEVKEATFEMAYAMLDEDLTATNDLTGIKSMKIGPLSIVADKYDRAGTIPDTVIGVLGVYGKIYKSNQIKLVRT